MMKSAAPMGVVPCASPKAASSTVSTWVAGQGPAPRRERIPGAHAHAAVHRHRAGIGSKRTRIRLVSHGVRVLIGGMALARPFRTALEDPWPSAGTLLMEVESEFNAIVNCTYCTAVPRVAFDAAPAIVRGEARSFSIIVL